MISLSNHAVVQQNRSCLAAEVQDEFVLMAIERGVYLALNPIGRDIWQRIAVPCTVSALRAALAMEFDASQEVIAADVLEFLEQLQGAGALIVTDA